MDKETLIFYATIAIYNGYSFEQMKDSDYFHGKEDQIIECWKYVDLCNHIGKEAFRERYANYKMMF